MNTQTEILNLVVNVFPFAKNQKNSRTKEFPHGYTVQKMFKYLESVLGTDTKKRKASIEYQQKLISLKYTHNIDGPSTFFDELDDCHNRLTHLKIVVVDPSMLIQYAIAAFEKADIPKTEMTELKREWKTELTTNQ